MTESIILVAVMVPLFGAIPLLGKISDANNNAIQSSRYAAWERTVSGPETKTIDTIATEVNNRFFTQSDLPVKSGQGALLEAEHENPMWSGYGLTSYDRPDNRLFSLGGQSLFVSEDKGGAPGIAGELSSGVLTMGRALANISGEDWDLREESLFTANVGLELSTTRFLDKGKDCQGQESTTKFSCIRRSNTIMVDAWESFGAEQAEARAAALVPLRGLEPVGDVLAGIGSLLPPFSDLKGLESDDNGGFGYLDAEVVPLDRYIDP